MKGSLQAVAVAVAVLYFTVPASGAERVRPVDVAGAAADGWPVVAVNQSAAPRPDLEAPAEMKCSSCNSCIDPCSGGFGCGGYEVKWEAVCRTVGDYSQACEPSAGRYCAQTTLSSDLEDGSTGGPITRCQTCFYGFGLD